jgi:thioredoxin-like negative regulator of GroEL
MNRPAEAMPILQRVARQPAGYSEARSRIAALEYAVGRHAEAHTTIDAALAHDPSHVRALLTKAEFLIRDHQRTKRSNARRRRSTRIHVGRRAYARIDLRVRASGGPGGRQFQEVLKLNPRRRGAHELARLQLARGDVDRATDGERRSERLRVGRSGLLLVRASSPA